MMQKCFIIRDFYFGLDREDGFEWGIVWNFFKFMKIIRDCAEKQMFTVRGK